MRKFRLINPYGYNLEKGVILDEDFPLGLWTYLKDVVKLNPEDWQEVFEEDSVSIEDMNKAYDKAIGFNSKPLHKDTDLGYYVGLAMSAMVSRDHANSGWSDGASDQAIYIAQSIIKQLNEETK